jgi:predicted SAM-dependent methyltransferase
MKRVHLACGDIYLHGYENVDRVGALIRVQPIGCNLENYYDHKLHDNREPLIDRWMDIEKGWMYEPESVDEFVMVSAFEHFSREAAERLLQNVYTSLKFGGVFKFDFPDIQETVRKYYQDPEYMMRLIYGSQKNDGAFHRWGYTKETIVEKLKKNPWKSIDFGDVVKHEYPMIGVSVIK